MCFMCSQRFLRMLPPLLLLLLLLLLLPVLSLVFMFPLRIQLLRVLVLVKKSPNESLSPSRTSSQRL